MSVKPIKDYTPSSEEVKNCLEHSHNFSWITLLGRVYKTCSRCGHIELMTALEEG